MIVPFKKLRPDAITPQYATAGAACFDLSVLTDHTIDLHSGAHIFDTGLAFEVPQGHVMLLFSRSGSGFNHDTRLANCVGVIDSDYRGEVKVKLNRDLNNGKMLNIKNGDRIAQAMVIPITQVTLSEVSQLADTARGTGGMGSTGSDANVTMPQPV